MANRNMPMSFPNQVRPMMMPPSCNYVMAACIPVPVGPVYVPQPCATGPFHMQNRRSSETATANTCEDESCSICLEPTTRRKGQAIIFTGCCNKPFHMKCLAKWEKNECPCLGKGFFEKYFGRENLLK